MLRGIAVLLLVLAPNGVKAADDGKVIQEVWENALLDNGQGGFIKVGHVHLTVQSIERDGKKILRTTKELRLNIRRGNAIAQVSADTGTEELADGTVVGVFMRQVLGKQQTLVLNGTVDGNQLRLKIDGQGQLEKSVGWNPAAISQLGEYRILATRKPKPGDTFDYQIFDPTLAFLVTVQVKAISYEMMPVVQGQRKMLKVIATPEKVQGVQLPTSTIWADAETFTPLQSEVEIPGIGKLRMVRASKEHALAQTGELPADGDILRKQAITIDRPIPQIHQQRAVTYRLTFTGEDNPMTAFASDNRQEIKKVEGLPKSIDLTVEALRRPQKTTKAEPAGEEYIKSNYFINSDDALVKKLAIKAVGEARDPWEKAQRIERWVNQNMKSFVFSESLATADEVAKNLSGDCSEYAMLTAAMCRSQGIPSRTAIGVVYYESRPQPTLPFHMWTEVFIDGQWLALDATLGFGSVGPGHLKITDASWHEVRSLTPLLPVMRVILAKPKAEVVRVYTGGNTP